MAMSLEVERTFRLGDVFSKAFGVFGRNFIAFFILTVIANIPRYVFELGFAQAPTGQFNPWDLLVVPIGILCATIANGAMTYGVVEDLRGEPVSIPEAITMAARRFLPMLGVAFLVGILSALATILFIVPGFIVMCMYFVAAPVCLAERAGVRASLSRSRYLTKGNRWQIFGAYILMILLALILGGIAAAAAFYAGRMASTVLRYGVQAVFGAFTAVIASVFYYELRVSKEGIDLAKIASVFD
jgi:hypothetical protein